MDSLLVSALGPGIIQGAVISQADIGAEGLPESLTEERGLSCARCFREQEGAVERGRELGQGALSSLCSPHSSKFSPLKNSQWLPVLCHINPSLTSFRTGAFCCTPSCLTFHPGHLWCLVMPYIHSLFLLPTSPPTVLVSLSWSL